MMSLPAAHPPPPSPPGLIFSKLCWGVNRCDVRAIRKLCLRQSAVLTVVYSSKCPETATISVEEAVGVSLFSEFRIKMQLCVAENNDLVSTCVFRQLTPPYVMSLSVGNNSHTWLVQHKLHCAFVIKENDESIVIRYCNRAMALP